MFDGDFLPCWVDRDDLPAKLVFTRGGARTPSRDEGEGNYDLRPCSGHH
jgi:hypothetical protein